MEAMRPSVDASPWAGVEGVQDNLGGSQLWEYSHDGRRVLLAVRALQLEAGRVLEVTGMRSLGDRVQAAPLLAVLDYMGRDLYAADLLSMQTRRPHLVAGCVRNGWSEAARVVVKNLNTKH
jgi:hypothetical protein